MKKYICLLLAFVMATGMLSGCLSADDHNLHAQPSTTASTAPATTPTIPTTVPTVPTILPAQPTTNPTQPEELWVEVESETVYGVSFTYNPDSSIEWPLAIRSVEELWELPEYGSDSYKYDGVCLLDSYDDAFLQNIR